MLRNLFIVIQGKYLKSKIDTSLKSNQLIHKLNKIISEKAIVSSDVVIVYQLDEADGSIEKLSMPEGIPSNNNYLNNNLRECNQLFDSLLEIEEEL